MDLSEPGASLLTSPDGCGGGRSAILMSISGRAPDQNVESCRREFLGLGHPEQRGDAPVPLHGGASPGLGRGGGGGALLSHLLQLPVIADEAWKRKGRSVLTGAFPSAPQPHLILQSKLPVIGDKEGRCENFVI